MSGRASSTAGLASATSWSISSCVYFGLSPSQTAPSRDVARKRCEKIRRWRGESCHDAAFPHAIGMEPCRQCINPAAQIPVGQPFLPLHTGFCIGGRVCPMIEIILDPIERRRERLQQGGKGIVHQIKVSRRRGVAIMIMSISLSEKPRRRIIGRMLRKIWP
jgi:hypothetical protein